MITEDHLKELNRLLERAITCEDLLTEWERDFITDWVDRVAEIGANIRITPNQQYVLDHIEEKLKKHGEL